MDNNFNSFNPVSGADSASVQEQFVKGSLSSSNFNIVDELEEVDLDFHKYDYRSGHPAATRILWPPADGCTVMSRIPSLPISIMRTCPMNSIRRAASMRPRSSAFSSTLTSMMTSRRPSGRFWMSRATAMRISRFFDFKAFARELFMSDYDMGDGGHVFRTC